MQALKVIDFKTTLKRIVKKDGEVIPLIHLEGVQATTGLYVDKDLWPRCVATDEDLEKLFEEISHEEEQTNDAGETVKVKVIDGYKPKVRPSDIRFRVGYFKTVTEDGEILWKEGQPRWLGLFVGDNFIELSGGKREYDGE